MPYSKIFGVIASQREIQFCPDSVNFFLNWVDLKGDVDALY